MKDQIDYNYNKIKVRTNVEINKYYKYHKYNWDRWYALLSWKTIVLIWSFVPLWY